MYSSGYNSRSNRRSMSPIRRPLSPRPLSTSSSHSSLGPSTRFYSSFNDHLDISPPSGRRQYSSERLEARGSPSRPEHLGLFEDLPAHLYNKYANSQEYLAQNHGYDPRTPSPSLRRNRSRDRLTPSPISSLTRRRSRSFGISDEPRKGSLSPYRAVGYSRSLTSPLKALSPTRTPFTSSYERSSSPVSPESVKRPQRFNRDTTEPKKEYRSLTSRVFNKYLDTKSSETADADEVEIPLTADLSPTDVVSLSHELAQDLTRNSPDIRTDLVKDMDGKLDEAQRRRNKRNAESNAYEPHNVSTNGSESCSPETVPEGRALTPTAKQQRLDTTHTGYTNGLDSEARLIEREITPRRGDSVTPEPLSCDDKFEVSDHSAETSSRPQTPQQIVRAPSRPQTPQQVFEEAVSSGGSPDIVDGDEEWPSRPVSPITSDGGLESKDEICLPEEKAPQVDSDWTDFPKKVNQDPIPTSEPILRQPPATSASASASSFSPSYADVSIPRTESRRESKGRKKSSAKGNSQTSFVPYIVVGVIVIIFAVVLLQKR